MEKEEKVDELDTENEEFEEGLEDDLLDLDNESTEESEEDNNAEVERLKQIARDQKLRAEKAEKRLKLLSQEKETPKNTPSQADSSLQEKPTEKSQDNLSKDEVKLYARGLDDEGVEKVKKIASVEGITIDEAFKSDYYEAWKARREKEEGVEKSQLRASRGGQATKRKTLTSTDLSDEEHKALWREKFL